MDRIFFENIRCFATRQEARLAPLTILVGENSSGKSTFLALVRLAWDLARNRRLDFNEEPFLLGAYPQVASVFRKDQGDFSFGIGVKETPEVEVEGTFRASPAGLPLLVAWSLNSPMFRLSVKHDVWEPPESLFLSAPAEHEAEELAKWLRYLRGSLGARPYAFAPMRTRPERTYDPIRGVRNPEGSHIPVVLASAPLRDRDQAKAFFSALGAFGRHSGLFDKVEVRRLGESESDPFQIQVHLGGQRINLMDVGYGVSQVLPIVVDCLRGEKGGTFLLQQPEAGAPSTSGGSTRGCSSTPHTAGG